MIVPLIFSAENNGAQKRLKTSITEHNNSNDATDDTNIQKEESVNATIASCSDNENESLEEQRDEAHQKEDDISDTEARRRDSIVYQLIHRSTTASRLHNPPAAHKSWSPWAVLDTSGAVATCTAWDEQGVLLAVATSAKTVCVYDSDVVRVPQSSTTTTCNRTNVYIFNSRYGHMHGMGRQRQPLHGISWIWGASI